MEKREGDAMEKREGEAMKKREEEDREKKDKEEDIVRRGKDHLPFCLLK